MLGMHRAASVRVSRSASPRRHCGSDSAGRDHGVGFTPNRSFGRFLVGVLAQVQKRRGEAALDGDHCDDHHDDC